MKILLTLPYKMVKTQNSSLKFNKLFLSLFACAVTDPLSMIKNSLSTIMHLKQILAIVAFG